MPSRVMYDFYPQAAFNHPSSASSSSRASSPLSDAGLSHVPDYLALASQDTSYSHNDATYLPSHHISAPDMPPHSAHQSAHTFSRPLLPDEKEKLAMLDRLRLFLATAPLKWSSSHDDLELGMSTQIPSPPKAPSSHPAMKRFTLPHPVGEHISCVLWSGRYYITGTDIVRALVFRFDAFGRPVKNMKKFEEGVFSDLRNLKPGIDASLEEPKSPFLDLLFKYQCIRTQKKQKVFFWQSVPHDRLFLDALERDLKREKTGLEPTSVVAGEPALSFTYDSQRSLYEQYSKNRSDNVDSSIGSDQRRSSSDRGRDSPVPAAIAGQVSAFPGVPGHGHGSASLPSGSPTRAGHHPQASSAAQNGIASSMLQSYVFDGNPTYKQRRKRPAAAPTHGHGLNKSYPGAAATGFSSRTGFDDGFGDGDEGASSAGGGSSSAFDMGIGYGPSDRSMTAADMFVSQARGEQDADVRRTREQVLRAHRDAFAKAKSLGYSGAQLVSPGPDSASGDDSSAHSRSSSAASMTGAVSKAYVCPVFSCGRLFRQPEFLQRHVAHSHVSIPSHNSEQSVAGQQHGDQLNHRLAAFASSSAHTLGVGAAAANGVYSGLIGDLGRHAEQYAIVVSGMLQDVLGDDEGVVTVVSDSRQHQRPATAPTSSVDYTTGYPMAGLLTTTQPEFAYAMGTGMGGMDIDMNMDGLSASSLSMPSSFETTTSTTMPLTGPSLVDEFHSTFDTRSATAAAAGASPSSVPAGANGPVRRHRSITPSLMHSHTHAHGHQHHSSSPSPRGYHPYATTGHSRVSSSHSSPRGLASGLSLSPTGTSLGFRPAMMPRALSAQPQAHAANGVGSGLPASFDGVFGTNANSGFESLHFGAGSAIGDFANASMANQDHSQMHTAMDTSASPPPFLMDDWPWVPSPYTSAGIFSGVPS